MKVYGYQHRSGLNCETACQRNVLSALGVHLDEDCILGLDGSFGFGYFERSGDEPDLVIGRQQIFPGQAARLLGARMIGFQCSDSRRILNYLEQQRPVIARVDFSELPYWQGYDSVPFGGYFINIVGYQKGAFLISDPGFNELQMLEEATLQKARQSKKSPPINPERWCYVIEQVRGVPDISRIGFASVENCAREMLKPSTSNLGLPGLKRFARALPSWSKSKAGLVKVELNGIDDILTMPALARQLLSLGRSIEVFGTGGGLFRPMWSRYLHHLGSITNNVRLLNASEHMKASAQLWTTIGQSLISVDAQSNRSYLDDLLADLIVTIDQILEHERQALDALKSIKSNGSLQFAAPLLSQTTE